MKIARKSFLIALIALCVTAASGISVPLFAGDTIWEKAVCGKGDDSNQAVAETEADNDMRSLLWLESVTCDEQDGVFSSSPGALGEQEGCNQEHSPGVPPQWICRKCSTAKCVNF